MGLPDLAYRIVPSYNQRTDAALASELAALRYAANTTTETDQETWEIHDHANDLTVLERGRYDVRGRASRRML